MIHIPSGTMFGFIPPIRDCAISAAQLHIGSLDCRLGWNKLFDWLSRQAFGVPCAPKARIKTKSALDTHLMGVQSCAGGSATPTLVFSEGELLKSNMSSSVLAS